MNAIRMAALAFLALSGGSVNALEAARPSPFVQRSIVPGLTRQAFVVRSASVFDRLDADGDGFLDVADALAYGRAEQALARASNVSRLLAFDLDADGRLSLQEIASGLRRGLPLPDSLASSQTADPDATASAVLVVLDANADGRVDVPEMLAIAVPDGHINPVSAFLQAFPPAGGRLSREAFVSGMLAQAFDRADADGDGVLSAAEVDAASSPVPAR
jgi:Ca2+-binding EF-hand superfamily protein